MTSTYQDFAGCSVTTSNYKWLTAKLLAAQKQYNVRPYFQCKIVDDTIAAQSPLTLVSGGANLPKYGKFVTAPDGALIGVGLYSDNIVFFKVADGTNGSSWASNTILATDVNINPPANTIPCTISVSDFINGTYRIDVYYVTFPAGGNVTPHHIYSNDGGSTWTADSNAMNTIGITSATAGVSKNVSIAAGKPILLSSGSIQSVLFYIESNTFSYSHSGGNTYNG